MTKVTCKKCRQSAPTVKEIIHRISCTDYAKGRIMPIARIVSEEK